MDDLPRAEDLSLVAGGTMDTTADRSTRLGQLSQRQLKIVRLTGAGRLDREIGERLAISPRTVKFHKGNIDERLGLAGLDQPARLTLLAAYCQDLATTDVGDLPPGTRC